MKDGHMIRVFFVLLFSMASLLGLHAADEEASKDQGAKSQNPSGNIARGPVTQVPQNGGFDPRIYDGGYYYQPAYPNYYGPQKYDPYDPRNYEQYYYDPYDPRSYERYYYYAPQVPYPYPAYPQYGPQYIPVEPQAPAAPQPPKQDEATPPANNGGGGWFDEGKAKIQLAPMPPNDIAISYAPRIPPLPQAPGAVNVVRPSYPVIDSGAPLENALADPKSSGATLNAGVEAARKGDYKSAISLFNTACDQGNPAGCFGVGVMFMYGAGVQSDTQKAIKYYQKGCAGGDPTACANLGMIYDEAPNMGNNKQKAAEMYMTGCAGGDIEACNNTGWAYANGSGVPKDINKALQYYRFACDAGSQLGCYNLGLLNNAGTAYGINGANLHPVDMNFVACNAGDVVGCANLGWIYSQGLEGAPRNYGLAAQYFNTACIGGVASSCNNLGVLYEEGRGITRNAGQALELYSLACESGIQNGCDNYANLQKKIK